MEIISRGHLLSFYKYFVEVITRVSSGAVVFGHYLMLNIAFHYWMALTTQPGVPPSDVILTEVKNECLPFWCAISQLCWVSIVKIYSPGYRIISCTLEMVCPKSCHNQVENVSSLSNAWALFRRVVGVWDGRVMQLTHNSQAGTEVSSQKFKATAAHEFWGSITYLILVG